MIKNTLQEKIKEALKSGDVIKTSTYRMLLAALNNEQIAKQLELTDEEEVVVIKRQLKQREEAVSAYEGAGRTESAEKEKAEAEILKEFLPEQLSELEIRELVDEVLGEMGEVRDFGAIMKQIMAKVQGKADGKIVSEIVLRKLK